MLIIIKKNTCNTNTLGEVTIYLFIYFVYTHPKWIELGIYYLYLLNLMKMTYGSLGRSGTGPFNLILNTAVAYDYEYNGEIRFLFLGKYKQNK